jgi:hypothetical protein
MRSIAIADLNDDGNLDVVAAVGYRLGGYVAVLLGNGDGTLATAVDYTVHGRYVPLGVIVGDFNDDGIIDIAVANGSLYTLNGNGDGTFQEAKVICPASELAAADLNDDGRTDIVTNYGVLLNEGGGSLHFLRFNSNEVIGGSVTVADFNGDGIPDLVSSNVGILLGRGNGTFKPPLAIYREGPSAGALAVADFNGDGKLDIAQIASAYPGGVAVYFGKGNGTLNAVRNFNTDIYVTQLATADFNNDGNEDLAAFGQDRFGNPALAILLGNGTGTLQTAMPTFNPVGTVAVIPGDFNSDGKIDLAVLSDAPSAEEVLIFLGNGDGTFQSPTISHFSGGAVAMSIADFDANGTLDVALLEPCYNCPSSVVILSGNGDGTFKTGGTFEVGVGSNSIVSADFNNDGVPDLAIANALGYEHEPGTLSVLVGNGDGTFQKQVPIVNAGKVPTNIMAADLTGNGNQDLIVTNAGGVFSVIFGHGNGKFSGLASTTGVGSGPLAIADFNGDGIEYHANQKINLVIEMVPEGGSTAATVVPAYVYDAAHYSNWCTQCVTNGAMQDMVSCPAWSGSVSAPTCKSNQPNPPLQQCASTNIQAGVWNQNECHLTGVNGKSCGTSPFTDISGYPVLYEEPIITAYETFVGAVLKHYSSQGTGNGPTIGKYIGYIRIGLANGGENLPTCTSTGSGSNTVGIWPSPQGLDKALNSGGNVTPDWFVSTNPCPGGGGATDEAACRGKYMLTSPGARTARSERSTGRDMLQPFSPHLNRVLSSMPGAAINRSLWLPRMRGRRAPTLTSRTPPLMPQFS